MPREKQQAVIPCRLEPAVKLQVDEFADALQQAAPTIGHHGLREEEFWRTGIFRAAVEKIRGTFSATTSDKQAFVGDVLDWLQSGNRITGWARAGTNDRHDYEVTLPSGRVCAIEAKGCLDGNNTNIFQRPANADEFVIWSMCQNPGADPRHNAWSGIHTRLSAEVVYRREVVDALIIWDELCGTLGRPCPKRECRERSTRIGKRIVPPPCIYLFPRTVPDPRNNPTPVVHGIGEVEFVKTMYDALACDAGDVTEVRIEAQMKGASIARKTTLVRDGAEIRASALSVIKRAR
ncbi:MAG TPA: hypothetical protein PLZ95_05845 [Bryobacteraceae bacterium]|nr:hypothetical protein [Bryobacteraceae bacterium]